MRRSAVAAAAAGLLLGGGFGVPLAHAAFATTATAASTFTAAALAAPSGLTATKRCSVSALGIVLSAELVLAWTPSSTSWAQGQRVVVTDGLGAVVSSQDVSATTRSATVSLPLLANGSYTATVRARYGSWTSAAATASSSGC